MLNVPDYHQNLSLRLSEVLDDIGVNERMVLKRRRAVLLNETMLKITGRSIYSDMISTFTFGSLSEGTTTTGLQSDFDNLICDRTYNVIQNVAEWEQGFTNLLMIQDNTLSPGYCLLQQIREDVPLPTTHVIHEDCVRDTSGRVLLKNTLLRRNIPAYAVQHGPSWAKQGSPGFKDQDLVTAFHCNSWPYEARAWLDRQRIGRWPNADIKRFAKNSGCFVVPVGSKCSQNPELEWRISTSEAERCLMLSLNITQLRCYVLMKMILKTFLHHAGEGHITSFMCKTVLLHCIENTLSNVWHNSNLFTCFTCCLHVLYNCLQHENCPHFITPGNNLMAGQFSPEVKALLKERMFHLIQTGGRALLGVQTDDLGQRLQIKMNIVCLLVQNITNKKENCLDTSGILLQNTATSISTFNCQIISKITQNDPVTTVQQLVKVLAVYARCYKDGSKLEQKASSLLARLLATTLGTVTASINIQTNNTIPPEALIWLSAGLKSDVSSSRLKLASVFYSVGNMVETEFILTDTERLYGYQEVEPMCGCYEHSKPTYWAHSAIVAYNQNEDAVRSVCAFCIIFVPTETHCVPFELQYEMFRSTQDDLLHRGRNDYWMDWAVVDSLPYLYFLQYKTYDFLQRFGDQHQALTNLVRTAEEEPNLGHRETALNLLGQCMEQENQPNKALNCYMKSLTIRERNNAASIHICKLLAKMLRA